MVPSERGVHSSSLSRADCLVTGPREPSPRLALLAGPCASPVAGTDSGLLPPILALEEHGLAVGCLQIVCSTFLKKWILLPSPGLG